MRDLVCIVCPRGCRLHIDNKNKVTGNFCPRGAKYAISEITHPERIVTSTVRLTNSNYPRVSVKTEKPIPKEMIFNVMKEIDQITLKAPTHIGDIAIKDVCHLGVNVVVTKNILK